MNVELTLWLVQDDCEMKGSAASVHPSRFPATQKWATMLPGPGFNLSSFAHLQGEVHDPAGDIHAGRRDRVAELHRVVDLEHGVAVADLDQVDRQHAAAAGPRRRPADAV